MVWKMGGKMANRPDACVNPRPMLSESEMIIMLRSLKPHLANIPNPANIIEPNMMTVHPPRTACGIVVSSVPTMGKMPPKA